jgi:hypothetical protein
LQLWGSDHHVWRTILRSDGYQGMRRIFLDIVFLAVRGLGFEALVALDKL